MAAVVDAVVAVVAVVAVDFAVAAVAAVVAIAVCCCNRYDLGHKGCERNVA